MKNIVITGASGFIGKRLTHRFLSSGCPVTGIGTSGHHPFEKQKAFEWIAADTTLPGQWQAHVSKADIIVNLAGRTIFKRWTEAYKQAVYDSRVKTTKHIVNAIDPDKETVLLSASAVGFYGDCGDAQLTETDSPGYDFLASVCVDWEKEAVKARQKNTRVAVMRFGIVLGKEGALKMMVPAFRFFAGGSIGSGDHWFPWIHITDLENAIFFIIGHETLDGVFNFTGPGPIRQKMFAKALGQVLHRPVFFKTPSFILKALMGELGSLLLQSQKAIPERLLDAQFNFLYADAKTALSDLF